MPVLPYFGFRSDAASLPHLPGLHPQVNGKFAAGWDTDALFDVLQPFVGPSFEGMARGLAGMSREMWTALDCVGGAQQVQSWLDLFLEIQQVIQDAPAVCVASDIGSVLSDTRDKPGEPAWSITIVPMDRGHAWLAFGLQASALALTCIIMCCLSGMFRPTTTTQQ